MSEVAAPAWRRRLRLVALALLALVLLLAALLAWLLGTAGGRDFALARAGGALGDQALAWRSAEGTLGGGLVLHGLALELAAARIEVERAELDFAPGALLARRLHLRSLQLAGVTVRLRAVEAANGDDTLQLRLPRLRPPLSLQLDALLVEDFRLLAAGASEPTLSIDRLGAAGGFSRAGRLTLERLAVDAAAGALRAGGALGFHGARDLELALRARGPGEDAPWARAELSGRGEQAEVDLALPEGGEDRVQLALGRGEAWHLEVQLEGFDPSPWWPDYRGAPLSLELAARGEGLGAGLEGRVASEGFGVRLAPSQLRLDLARQQLVLSPLRLEPDGGGALVLDGALALDPAADSRLDFQLEGLPLAEAGSVDGRGRASGRPQAWKLEFDGALATPKQRLPLRLAASGDADHAEIAQLALGGDGAAMLAGSGRIGFTPAPTLDAGLELSGFDPALLLADWPGRLDGRLRIEARRDDGGWGGRLRIDALQGPLRGLPLDADGEVALAAGQADGALRLAWGESRVRILGRAGDALDLEARLEPLQLDPLAAGLSGRLEGTVRLRGSRDAPAFDLDLGGSGLALDGRRVGALTLTGSFAGLDAGDPLQLALDASDLELGALSLDRLEAAVDGRTDRHALRLTGRSDTLEIDAALDGGLGDDGWRGTLSELELRPGERRWRLDAPAALALGADTLTLDSTCLAGQRMRLCAEASRGDGALRADLRLERLPLAALLDFAPDAGAWPMALSGELEGEARLQRPDGGSARIDGSLSLPEGRLAVAGAEGRELLAWSGLRLGFALDPTSATLDLDGQLEGSGQVSARLSGGSPLADPAAALEGSLELELPRLRVLELLAPELAAADGTLSARIDIGGRWNQPQLRGRADARALRGELPGLGIAFSDSRLSLNGDGNGRLRVEGQLDSGEGVLAVSGWIEPTASDGLRGELALDGERVRVAETVFVSALASPELVLKLAPDRIDLSGRVEIPEARLDLENLDNSVRPSSDVVVLDPRAGDERGVGPPLHASVDVVLGEQVRLRGFGFDGQVRGRLGVLERPGRVATGRGSLDVTGQYEAYGQDLEVVRGGLRFSGTPLDDPALDVRAERTIDSQVVGIEVRGSALVPRLTLYSNPPLDQAEALSWLVLGRPLNSATEADGAKLGQAAVAMGGNLLAERLGARLGFDTFEVGDSRALGGAAFSVGKYLSPKLYLGYGVALFGSGQVLTLRYLLSSQWELEVESGTENRAGVNYKLER